MIFWSQTPSDKSTTRNIDHFENSACLKLLSILNICGSWNERQCHTMNENEKKIWIGKANNCPNDLAYN